MKKLGVFVSSTYKDLIDERKEASQAILEAKCIPMGMELFSASYKRQWDVIKREIDDSDIYILIIAGCSGTTGIDDDGKRKSYTEMEFDYGVKRNKPIFTFYHKDISTLPSWKIESQDYKRKKLSKFTNKAKDGRMAKSWNNKDDLKSVILQSLKDFEDELNVGGWIHIPAPVQYYLNQIESAKELGLVSAFDKRSIAIGKEYNSRLPKAHEKIDIMGFCLSSMLKDIGDQFEHWTKCAPVRILLIDPDFPQQMPLADIRDNEERNPKGSIRSGVEDFLRNTRDLWSNPNIDFNIRLSTVLPSINMFRIDDEIFWGPYLVDSVSKRNPLLSRNLPTMIVGKGGIMYPRLIEHFEAIWNDPKKSKEPI